MCLEALLLSPLVWLPLHSLTDRKSTRLNSSHSQISYAVFCLKKKKTHVPNPRRPPCLHQPPFNSRTPRLPRPPWLRLLSNVGIPPLGQPARLPLPTALSPLSH